MVQSIFKKSSRTRLHRNESFTLGWKHLTWFPRSKLISIYFSKFIFIFPFQGWIHITIIWVSLRNAGNSPTEFFLIQSFPIVITLISTIMNGILLINPRLSTISKVVSGLAVNSWMENFMMVRSRLGYERQLRCSNQVITCPPVQVVCFCRPVTHMGPKLTLRN